MRNHVERTEILLEEEKSEVDVSTISGRLQYFYHEWQELTKDKTILQYIKGFRIPLIGDPKEKIIRFMKGINHL